MLNIKSRQEGEVVILTLGGLLTAGRESTNLYKTIQQLVDDGKTNILLGFSEVSYIDSAGIGEGGQWFYVGQEEWWSVKTGLSSTHCSGSVSSNRPVGYIRYSRDRAKRPGKFRMTNWAGR